MAIDPRISLAVRAPDVGQAFSNALLNVQRFQGIEQTREQAPLRNQLLQAQVGTAEAGQTETEQNNRLRSLAIFGTSIAGDLQSGNLASIRAKTVQRIAQDLPSQGLPSNDSQELLALIDDPNISEQDKLSQIGNLSSQAITRAQQFGILKAPGGALSSGQRERADILKDLEGATDPTTGRLKPVDQLTVRQQQAAMEAGFLPRAVGSASQTITGAGTADVVATTEATIAEKVAGAKVTGAATAKAKSAPLIAKTESFINTQVKLAEKAAAERGEVLTDLARMEATLPGLKEVVTGLRELAKIATSTIGGRVFDVASKELGFGATKGATARTKFGAMVNNQILPLLKPTFGGSFSVEEGKELKATMGDKDLSIDEKLATLDSFMEQKERDIRGKKLQLDSSTSPAAPQVEVGGLSDEDLFNF